MSDTRTLILGTGLTGQSFKRYRPDALLLDPQIEPLPDAALLDAVSEVWISPGIAPHTEIVQTIKQHGIPIKSDIQVFSEHLRALTRNTTSPHSTCRIIAITGTNGKSTITTLVSQMLSTAGVKATMGGNIGVPVLDLLQQPLPQVFVLEISSAQLYYTAHLNADIAVLLNLAPDHKNWHGSCAAYYQAKRKIFDGAAIKLDFSNSQCSETTSVSPTWAGDVALNIASHLEIDAATAKTVLSDFKGLAHRCEPIPTQDNIYWINDSKATNPHATLYAINCYATANTRIILLAGGMSKGQDFTTLAQAITDKAHHAILFGAAAKQIFNALQQLTPHDQLAVTIVTHLHEAVQVAKKLAQPQDTVLLSPACASFDEFKNFAERGDVFRACVGKKRYK